jgi:D-hydroxyproline dehydrogenase subunit beta
MTMERWDAVVIGAGVIGSAVSYFLAEAGLRVCLVDRGAVAGGTSSASAGHTSVQGRVPGPALDLALANIRLLEAQRVRDAAIGARPGRVLGGRRM